LEADHRGINKFKSNTDPNYVKVLEKLQRLVESAPDILKRGTDPSLPVASRGLMAIYVKLHQIRDLG
jgi:hypothetical protein